MLDCPSNPPIFALILAGILGLVETNTRGPSARGFRIRSRPQFLSAASVQPNPLGDQRATQSKDEHGRQ